MEWNTVISLLFTATVWIDLIFTRKAIKEDKPKSNLWFYLMAFIYFIFLVYFGYQLF